MKLTYGLWPMANPKKKINNKMKKMHNKQTIN